MPLYLSYHNGHQSAILLILSWVRNPVRILMFQQFINFSTAQQIWWIKIFYQSKKWNWFLNCIRKRKSFRILHWRQCVCKSIFLNIYVLCNKNKNNLSLLFSLFHCETCHFLKHVMKVKRLTFINRNAQNKKLVQGNSRNS